MDEDVLTIKGLGYSTSLNCLIMKPSNDSEEQLQLQHSLVIDKITKCAELNYHCMMKGYECLVLVVRRVIKQGRSFKECGLNIASNAKGKHIKMFDNLCHPDINMLS